MKKVLNRRHMLSLTGGGLVFMTAGASFAESFVGEIGAVSSPTQVVVI